MVIRLTIEEAIVIRNSLRVFLQNTQPESRDEIKKILDALTERITMAVKG